MKASVVDLRYKMNEVLKALDRRKKVIIRKPVPETGRRRSTFGFPCKNQSAALVEYALQV